MTGRDSFNVKLPSNVGVVKSASTRAQTYVHVQFSCLVLTCHWPQFDPAPPGLGKLGRFDFVLTVWNTISCTTKTVQLKKMSQIALQPVKRTVILLLESYCFEV